MPITFLYSRYISLYILLPPLVTSSLPSHNIPLYLLITSPLPSHNIPPFTFFLHPPHNIPPAPLS